MRRFLPYVFVNRRAVAVSCCIVAVVAVAVIRIYLPRVPAEVEHVDLDDISNFNFPSGSDWTSEDIPSVARSLEGKFLEIRLGNKEIDAAGHLYIMRPGDQGWGGAQRTIRVRLPAGLPVPAADCLRISGTLHLRYHPVLNEGEGIRALWEMDAVSIEPEPVDVAVSQAHGGTPVPAPYWVTLGCAIGAILLLRARRSLNQIRAIERRLDNRCEVCGYDLRTNQSGRCPECGAVCEAAAPHPSADRSG